MSKVKGMLEEDMMRNPDLYNGHADYEFWIQCRKEELLERKGKETKITQKGRSIKCQIKKKK
jgi:hypothetical protein|tara:strand:+ start:186 stop:371 length:186 start_codon:yes stop_codon:yes gene_type:complete